MPIVPPGRHTRTSSRATAWWSPAKIAPNEDVTTSNSPSPNGSASASASTQSSSTPRAQASARPAAKFSGVRSEATTRAPAAAARSATFPLPAATSSTRCPGPIAAGRDELGPEPPHGGLGEAVVVAHRPRGAGACLVLGEPARRRRVDVGEGRGRSQGTEAGALAHAATVRSRACSRLRPNGPSSPGQMRSAQPAADRVRGRGRPRRQPELAQQVGDVAVHRVLADHQPLGDLAVGQALGEQAPARRARAG